MSRLSITTTMLFFGFSAGVFAQDTEVLRLDDPATGTAVQMERNKDGGLGLSVVFAGKTFITAPDPLHVELSDGEKVVAQLNGGYEDGSMERGVLKAHGSISRGDVVFRFKDSWKFVDSALVMDREVLCEGNREGGFMTGIRFRYPKPLKRNQLKIFAPGMIYGTSAHLPPGAIGGSKHQQFIRIREDRLPAPLFGAYFANGKSITVMNSRPDSRTTKEDSRESKARTLIDERFRFGAIGADFNADRPVFGYWFPGSEGGVTYRCSSHYDGQSENWSRRYHPVKDGLRQEYQVSFRVGFDPTFREYYHKTWRWAWDTLKPAVNPQDIELARRSLTDMLGERVVTHNGITGIRKISALPPRDEFPPNPRFHPRSTMGFTGAALQAAGYLLADSPAEDNPLAARNRKRGEAVVQQFLKLELAPPAGEGFYFDTGKPGITRPLRRLPEPIVFLRSFGDGLKALLETVKREEAAGRKHPEWVAWARSFADWLLPQQNPDGSFPRSWKQGTGEVYHRFPESTYTVIAYLVLLSEITDDPQYATAAKRAGEYCWNSSHKHGVFIGATLDQPNVIDKEAGCISLEAYLALYRMSSDRKWLQRAMAAASFAETWIYLWNVPMPEDEEDRDLFWKKGIPTVGMQGIATGHSLTDMYMAYDVDEFAELYLHTGDPHYYDVAMILLHNTKSMLALPGRQFDLPGPGWMIEHCSLAPTRGVGSLRAWLTWVNASQLNGILGLEELDRDLYLRMTRINPPVDSPNDRASKAPSVDRTGER